MCLCRKMSTEEKKKLGTALTQLSAEDLSKALEIVAENNPGFLPTAQEVDLDIDAQVTTYITVYFFKYHPYFFGSFYVLVML